MVANNRKLTIPSLFLMLFVLIGFVQPLPVAAEGLDLVPRRADEQLLKNRALQFMLLVNDARRDPLVAAERLGLDEQQVRNVFSDDIEVLEQGLPPLAWNERLEASASAHGRDMFDRLYYDYTTPEGVTVEQRIAEAGYQAVQSGEAMSALFFDNYVALDDALQHLVDAMLRDELTGTSGGRHIFNREFTELGVVFFAESIPLLDEQPYVYLLLADFATPLEAKHYAVIQYDDDSRLVMRTEAGGSWVYPESLGSGLAQIQTPEEATELVVVDDGGLGVVNRTFVLQSAWGEENSYVDLRTRDILGDLQ